MKSRHIFLLSTVLLWIGLVSVALGIFTNRRSMASSQILVDSSTGLENPVTNALQSALPRITSPSAGTEYVFGDPISFHAVDDKHVCSDSAYEVRWRFEKKGYPLPYTYTFEPNRVLDYAGGTHLMLLPGDYQVTVEMCGVSSSTVSFSVDYGPTVIGQPHPDYAAKGIVPPCIDWDDPDADSHRTSAHFNIYWNTSGSTCDGAIDPDPRPLTDLEVGLLECTYFTLSRWMTSPLDPSSIYRNLPDYDVLTHIPVYMGRTGGGGGSLPQGLFFGTQALNHFFAHELFHVFDYAGNPLHNRKAFDWRFENNAYHFYHEPVTRIQQTMGKGATRYWGYRSDVWPVWAPLDLGLLELDYDAGPFWAFVMDEYGDDFAPGGRETWEGPPFDVCQSQVEYDPQGEAYRPHNFKFFEAWNAQVRAEVEDAMDEGTPLENYAWDYCDIDNSRPDPSFLHVGQIAPPCLQTLEYEMQVMEDLIGARVDEEGTPLGESLMLDFAVRFAKAFPPNSLKDLGMPQSVSCADSPSLTYARGFTNTAAGCRDKEIDDTSVCPAVQNVNEHDFYARIQFRILEPRAGYLLLRANDDATLYMNGQAIIGESVDGNPSTEDYPNASTTYADQRDEWPNNNAPSSSIFPVGDPLGKTFEIEWVNRGDTRGNHDRSCALDNSRYLLTLEWSDQPISNTFQLLEDKQIEIISSQFWPNQGSGLPGFTILPAVHEIPDYDSYDSPIPREIQLRPVAWLQRPFLLPALGVNYHPVQCPLGYTGDLEVLVVDDHLATIHSQPSAHMLTLEDVDQVEWWGELAHPDPLIHQALLSCDGAGGPAQRGGKPAIILVTTRLTTHNQEPGNPSTMGAVHYTVFVKLLSPHVIYMPHIIRR